MTMFRCTAMALTLLLAGCQGSSSHGKAPGQPSLRVYDVPATQTDSLRKALDQALGRDQSSVSAPMPGKLLVYAPSTAQESIEQALSALSKSMPTMPATSLQARFWVVDAAAGGGADDPRLKSLEEALAPLEKSLGPMQFQMGQTVASALAYGKPSEISGFDGKQFSVVAMPSPAGTLDLEVHYADPGKDGGMRRLDAHVTARLGETIVLAQAPQGCGRSLGSGVVAPCSVAGLRLLVVRMDPATTTD